MSNNTGNRHGGRRTNHNAPREVPPPYEQAVGAPPAPAPPAPTPAPTHRRRDEGALTTEMKKLLKVHYIPEFENLVWKHDENFQKSSEEVKDWKKANSSEILNRVLNKEPPFDNVTSGLHEDDEHKRTDLQTIRRFFENHRNGPMRKMHSPSDNPSNTTTAKSISLSSAKKMTDTLIKFSTPMSPRNYFKSQNETKIRELAQGMDGNFQTAWAKLWDELTVDEKKHWEEAAAEYTDIGQNQEELFGLLGLFLQALLKSGRIGNAEFLLLGATRHPDGELVAHHVEVGTSGKSFAKTWIPQLGTDATQAQFKERFLDPLTNWAETALPDDVFSRLIERDEHDYPLFPKIDILRVPGDQMQRWLEVFFNHLYHKQYHEPLPWDQLTRSPEDFYDKNKYDFPEDLRQPTTMENIVDLVKFMKKLPEPFRFKRFVHAPTAAPVPTVSTSTTSEAAPVPSAAAPTATVSTLTASVDAPTPTPTVSTSTASEDAPVVSAVVPTATVSTSTASVDAPAATPAGLTSTASEDAPVASAVAPTAMVLTSTASVDAPAPTLTFSMSTASEDASVASAVAPTATVSTSTASVDAPAPTPTVSTLADNPAASVVAPINALTAAASVDALAATPIAPTSTGESNTAPPSAAAPAPAPTHTSSTTPENVPTTPTPSTLTPPTSSIPTPSTTSACPPPALENAPATPTAIPTPSTSETNKPGRGEAEAEAEVGAEARLAERGPPEKAHVMRERPSRKHKAENSETSAAGGITRRSARNAVAGPSTETGDAPVSTERLSRKRKADNGEMPVQAPPGKKPKPGWVWVLEPVQPTD
ncbi:hypothetical protein BT96DRAFT_1008203 [Gymnopus androsaceus JB14]|uniref:Uncharacterized protein n=1 Tax=Gymnopus androsaceus JB14 TaxID=1447944 RepID=A0A6A4GFS3_9AGAR|nr:hypothetical protein BT96DRAFT_1008203 [Gymnopus androsaceus JB14]